MHHTAKVAPVKNANTKVKGGSKIKTRYDKGIKLVYKFIKTVLPEVDSHLNRWLASCGEIKDAELRVQAVSSITHKKFHAQGGSVYSLYPLADLESASAFIVALQTISDYLDNLCDRAGVMDEIAFRQLHMSMIDAVDCNQEIRDYYKLYPYKEDSGYLLRLVNECRRHIGRLPAYSKVVHAVKEYVYLYSDLQSLKHIDLNIREKRLFDWACSHLDAFPGISATEFSAATGSTLGIFVLFAAASDPSLTCREVCKIHSVYFPWICGLHILLDYYIDFDEDMHSDDLNFTRYYDNMEQCEERLTFFFEEAYKRCSTLRYPEFHKTVIRGLLAMYLSDPKALTGRNYRTSSKLIKAGGMQTVIYHRLCRFLRHSGKL